MTASAAELDRYGGQGSVCRSFASISESIEFLALTMDVIAALPKATRISPISYCSPVAEGAGRRTNLDQARLYTRARGSAIAAALDTMQVVKLIDDRR